MLNSVEDMLNSIKDMVKSIEWMCWIQLNDILEWIATLCNANGCICMAVQISEMTGRKLLLVK